MSQSAVKFERPGPENLAYLAEHMRPADVAEVWASNRHTPAEALKYSIQSSKFTTVATVHDAPCVIFGLAIRDILSGIGVPWMLGSNEVLKHKRHLMIESRKVVDEMLTICSTLMNFVHVENQASVRWLDRIGFTLLDPIKYGYAGELFHPFLMGRKQDV